MEIPSPELIELGPEWAPWKFQVNTFGDGIHYGHKEHCVIRIGSSNYGTRKSAEAYLKTASR